VAKVHDYILKKVFAGFHNDSPSFQPLMF